MKGSGKRTGRSLGPIYLSAIRRVGDHLLCNPVRGSLGPTYHLPVVCMLDISWIPQLPGPSGGSQDRQGYEKQPDEEAAERKANDEQG